MPIEPLRLACVLLFRVIEMNTDEVYYGTMDEYEQEMLRENAIASLKLNNMVKSPSGRWHKCPPPARNKLLD